MRKLVYGVVACLAVTLGAEADAARMPSSGPDPNWTESQKFEWYLGYMSDAAAICRQFDAANQLADIANLSPFGRIGLNAITADGFTGAACGRIRNRTKELLQKKQTYIRYLTEKYDCAPGGKCLDMDIAALGPKHSCAGKLDDHLGALSVPGADVKSITFDDSPSALDRNADIQARVRLKSCSGSLYVEMAKDCKVRKSYTRGNCEFSGVSAY